MYIFSAGHCSVDNQYICSFQGKTTSPALSSVHLPAVFCVGLRPHVLFLSTLVCSLMSLAILLMRLYKHGFWFYSEIKFYSKLFPLLDFTIFYLLFHSFPVWEYFIDLSIGTGLPIFAFWLDIFFFNGFCLVQRQISLMWGEDYTCLKSYRLFL